MGRGERLRRVTVLASGTALALVACACGGPAHQSTTTTTGHPPTSTTVPTTTTTTTTKGVPTGGPLPSAFDPVSFTAVSPSDYWLLGIAPCVGQAGATGECPAVVRTTDGGATFVSLPAPPSPVAGTSGVATLRFATLLDGYAFGGPQAPFWDTHDGGEHWSQPGLAGVEAFGTGDGYAFAVTSACGTGSCQGFELRRSPIGADDWTVLPLPGAAASAAVIVSMAVHGPSVWLMVTLSTSTSPSKAIWRSTDSGASFASEPAPCAPELAGTIQPSSTSVLWAVCPTGMMASAYRSVNGGGSWSPIATPQMPNSARIAPASDTVAVVAAPPTGLLRTTDGGASFVRVTGHFPGIWAFVGFTDASTGSALLVLSTRASTTPHVPEEQLWRSTDGGVDWHQVTLGS
jgi:photosystem II stability/assembly factor-like uncharacterized protein